MEEPQTWILLALNFLLLVTVAVLKFWRRPAVATGRRTAIDGRRRREHVLGAGRGLRQRHRGGRRGARVLPPQHDHVIVTFPKSMTDASSTRPPTSSARPRTFSWAYVCGMRAKGNTPIAHAGTPIQISSGAKCSARRHERLCRRRATRSSANCAARHAALRSARRCALRCATPCLDGRATSNSERSATQVRPPAMPTTRRSARRT